MNALHIPSGYRPLKRATFTALVLLCIVMLVRSWYFHMFHFILELHWPRMLLLFIGAASMMLSALYATIALHRRGSRFALLTWFALPFLLLTLYHRIFTGPLFPPDHWVHPDDAWLGLCGGAVTAQALGYAAFLQRGMVSSKPVHKKV